MSRCFSKMHSKSKHTLDPAMMATVAARLAEKPGRRFKLVANLPYSVATPLIANLLAGSLVPETMTVTIQRELAERIVAQPGTKDYGALSVWVQCQCQVQLVRLMPPEAFWPRPKVTSAIVQIRLDPERREKIADRDFFHAFVRTLFLASPQVAAGRGAERMEVGARQAGGRCDSRPGWIGTVGSCRTARRGDVAAAGRARFEPRSNRSACGRDKLCLKTVEVRTQARNASERETGDRCCSPFRLRFRLVF